MAEKANNKCWNTPDFEVRFREAMGREMTAQEREYFGLTEESSSASGNASDESARTQTDAEKTKPSADRNEFAWPALRHITAVGG
jgi:hypothetical protein